jgi:outer membrane protein with beta-barrel domain
MRKLIETAMVVLVCAAAALCQIPGGNIYAGYSYLRADLSSSSLNSFSNTNLNGWNASGELKLLPWIGGVADFGANYGDSTFTPPCGAIIPCPAPVQATMRVNTYLFGPRASISLGKIRPFAEVLVGLGQIHGHGSSGTSNVSTSDTALATAVGGGLDYKLIPLLAWRFQGDYLHTRFFDDHQNNFRFSTGIVLRF